MKNFYMACTNLFPYQGKAPKEGPVGPRRVLQGQEDAKLTPELPHSRLENRLKHLPKLPNQIPKPFL